MNKDHDNLLKELIKLLEGGGAHATLNDALQDVPANMRGVKPHNLPYSIWQLAEHIRIAQRDMLEFSKDGNHSRLNGLMITGPRKAPRLMMPHGINN